MSTEPTIVSIQDESALFAFLEGRHPSRTTSWGITRPGGLTVTAFRPLAKNVRVRLADERIMELSHVRGGIWSATAPGSPAPRTTGCSSPMTTASSTSRTTLPVRPDLGQIDRHLINEGRHEQLWTVLGSHIREYGGPLGTVRGTSFAVWARTPPRSTSSATSTAGTAGATRMRVLNPSGIWELFVPGVGRGRKYQYAIRGQNGHVSLKSDPLALDRGGPSTASIVFDSHYSWGDQDWLDEAGLPPGAVRGR